jgi:microcystin degradation protein MlrC
VEVAGFLDVLGEAGIEVVPTLATFAMSGGRVEAATYRTLRDDLLARLAAAKPFDGVLLALHGAMVTDEEMTRTGRRSPRSAPRSAPRCRWW